MLDKIIHFSIYNKLIIGVFTVGLIVIGVYSAAHLPIDAVPDITNNQVQVITQAPTLGAQEVEQFITAPIELAMGNIPKVVERRSISRSGISVITIVFKDDADIYWARQQVAEKLKEAENNLPANLGEPSLAPITTGLGEIFHYVVHAKEGYEDKYSATDLRTIQDWIIKKCLQGQRPCRSQWLGWLYSNTKWPLIMTGQCNGYFHQRFTKRLKITTRTPEVPTSNRSNVTSFVALVKSNRR